MSHTHPIRSHKTKKNEAEIKKLLKKISQSKQRKGVDELYR